MSPSETLTISISNLLINFRNALVAIIPFAENVKIGWRDNEAYDDWDDIASTLYENIVQNSIRHGIQLGADDTELPPYDLRLPTYEGRNFISVKTKEAEDRKYLFLGFGTKKEPFDFVKCINIERTTNSHNTKEVILPLDDCNFELALHHDKDNWRYLANIDIEI